MGDHTGESEGAVAVVVALFIAFVGIGLLAFAIDLGSLWQSQRALVTDTDAAALAGAIDLAEAWMEDGECGARQKADAQTEAERLLADNNLQDEVIRSAAGCEPDPATLSDFSGWVQMTARQSSPGFVSGRDDLAAGGTSTAEFVLGIATFEEGLAICADMFPVSEGRPEIASEFRLSGGRLAIPYGLNADGTLREELGSACGLLDSRSSPQSPGGWGWLAPGRDDPPCRIDDEDAGQPWCRVDTGTPRINSFDSNVGERIDFPIFDAWNEEGGSNAKLKIVGYLSAVVDASCTISPSGGTRPKDPQLCNLDTNLSTTRFNGQQSHFIVVSAPEPYLIDYPNVAMFNEATYSICDVQGDRRFCRSSG